METEPHVSISLSAFNEGPFVNKTINAILATTKYRSFDILLHNDGSTDGSFEDIPRDSRVKVIQSESRHGVSGGKKIAIEASRGPLLLSLDCHVAPIEQNWLIRLIEVMRIFDYRVILSPFIAALNSETWCLQGINPRKITRLRNTFQVSWWKTVAAAEPWVEASSMRGIAKLMTREAYDTIGRFDDNLSYGGEEADVSIRAWLAGFPCCYVPTSLIGHVFKNKSQFPRSYEEDLVNRLRVAFKCLSKKEYEKVLMHNQTLFKNKGSWGAKVFRNATATMRGNIEELRSVRKETQSRFVRPFEWLINKFNIEL